MYQPISLHLTHDRYVSSRSDEHPWHCIGGFADEYFWLVHLSRRHRHNVPLATHPRAVVNLPGVATRWLTVGLTAVGVAHWGVKLLCASDGDVDWSDWWQKSSVYFYSWEITLFKMKISCFLPNTCRFFVAVKPDPVLSVTEQDTVNSSVHVFTVNASTLPWPWAACPSKDME